MDKVDTKIFNNPDYQELIRKRTPYSLIMTVLVLLAYYGFIFLVAFEKSFMSTPIAAGWTTTWGIVLGVGVILVTIVLTGIYVRRANTEFDPLIEAIVREARK